MSQKTLLRKRWGQATLLLSARQIEGGDGGCELEAVRSCGLREVASLRQRGERGRQGLSCLHSANVPPRLVLVDLGW